MFLALVITVGYSFLVWLIFFKLKLIKFSIGWGIVTALVGAHVLLIFLIGLRFVTPYSTDAKVIQHTIQLIPRLPEPTLVTGVLVAQNVPVKKGQPLFTFDRRPYEYKVNGIKAQLAGAQQKVRELKAQFDAATSTVAEVKAQRTMLKAALDAAIGAVAEARAKQLLSSDTYELSEAVLKADSRAISQLRLDQTRQSLVEADAAIEVALANEKKARVAFEEQAEAAIQVALANQESARLAYTSQINGVNTTVAQLQAELEQALYNLDNTTMTAPEDGYIINLQVEPGMVAGIFRVGAIASFVVDADRYVLASYYQEVLKYMKTGQPVEVALDLYPGQIFKGRVKNIWQGTGEGQYLPSGDLPKFDPPPNPPQGRFAVQIVLDDEDQAKFPIGTQGTAAIYTAQGGWAAMRRIGIRAHSWLNWLYPIPF